MDSSPGNVCQPSPSDHFLVLFASPPSSTSPSGGIGSDEFNESEVLWTSDSPALNDHHGQSRISSHFQCHDRHSSFVRPRNSGILAALADDVDDNLHHKQRIGPVLTRENSISSSSSSSRSIPRPLQSSKDREYSQSAPARKFQQSAPINVPVLSKAMAKQRNREFVATDDEDDDNEMFPPHEIVARGSGVSPKTTFSVLEGAGRTLKGRDLRRVRNAVWRRTGFLD